MEVKGVTFGSHDGNMSVLLGIKIGMLFAFFPQKIYLQDILFVSVSYPA